MLRLDKYITWDILTTSGSRTQPTSWTTPCPLTHRLISQFGPLRIPISLLHSTPNEDLKGHHQFMHPTNHWTTTSGHGSCVGTDDLRHHVCGGDRTLPVSWRGTWLGSLIPTHVQRCWGTAEDGTSPHHIEWTVSWLAVIHWVEAGAKHTWFHSSPPVEQNTSKGTKDNQGEGTSRPHRGMKRKVPEDVVEW